MGPVISQEILDFLLLYYFFFHFFYDRLSNMGIPSLLLQLELPRKTPPPLRMCPGSPVPCRCLEVVEAQGCLPCPLCCPGVLAALLGVAEEGELPVTGGGPRD